MRDLNNEEIRIVAGGHHSPPPNSPFEQLDNAGSEGSLVTPLDFSNDMRYFCLTLGVGACIAVGGG